MSSAYAIAGICSILSGGLGSAWWLLEDGEVTGFQKSAIVIAGVAAILGGLFALARRPTGVAIGLGGAAFFSNHGLALFGQQFDFEGSLDPTGAKLLLGAGGVGLVAIVVGLAAMRGRPNSGLGAIIAILAVVPIVAIGAIVHLDDARGAFQLGAVGGYLLLGLVITVGGLRGDWGVFASFTAALAHLPLWIEIAKGNGDRNAAAVAGTIAFGAITVFALMAGLASSSAEPTSPTRMARPPAPSIPTFAAPAMTAPVAAGPDSGRSGQSLSSNTQATHTNAAQSPDAHPGQRLPSEVAPIHATPGQWAADPFGRFQSRYWDGSRWTEHVASNGRSSIDPV